MRKKIMAFVFAAALLMALAVPLFGGTGTAQAIVDDFTPADECSGQAPVGIQAVLHGGIGAPGSGDIVSATVPNNNPGEGIQGDGGGDAPVVCP